MIGQVLESLLVLEKIIVRVLKSLLVPKKVTGRALKLLLVSGKQMTRAHESLPLPSAISRTNNYNEFVDDLELEIFKFSFVSA